ncbi:MAG: primase C-terminal domain-containing protein [Syntrophothermus sp.]
MISATTEEKNNSQSCNLAEFAVETLANGHKFYLPETDLPHSEQGEMYRSVYLYSTDIIDYYNTHYTDGGNKTIEGYEGIVWIDKLIIDIDDDRDLTKDHERVKSLLKSIESNYEVDLRYLSVNFSGSKGFHIRIPAELFGGFDAGVNLPTAVKNIALKITEGFIIDKSVYDKTRLMRVLNTINRKSKLFAVPLDIDELFSLTIDKIKELAKYKRELEVFDPDELIPVASLVDLKNKVLQEVILKAVSEGSILNDAASTAEESGKESKSSGPKEKVNYWEDAEPGNRHDKMIRLIGHLASHGFSDEEVFSAVQTWNNQLKTSKDESQLGKELKDALKSFGNDKGPFWTIRRDNKTGRTKVEVSMADYIGFLENIGYAKKKLSKSYAFVKVSDNKLSEIEPFEIKDEVLNYVKKSDKMTSRNKKLLLDQLIGFAGMYFSSGKLECVRSADAEIRRDKKHEAYLYFNNGYIVITKDNGISFHNYAEMEGLIWSSQIIKRDIRILDPNSGKSEFERFLMNVCRHSDERLKTLRSAIGYLLHEYKDSASAKAIVLIDEKIPSGNDPNECTGKSIVGKALSYIRKSTRVDGKNHEFDSKFTFQDVYLDTKIYEFNDVKKSFDFERLFSVITDDMSVEYKGEPKYTIPFSESPKFLISTNYAIKGRGSSYSDRLFEIEFSDYYNENHRPIDDFSHVFFTDDWDGEEWNRFHNFMIGCLHFYLQVGLVGYKRVNLELRKLIDHTTAEFVEFADEAIEPDTEYNKNCLCDKFTSHYNDFYSMKQRTFTGWVKEYSKYKGWEYRERKSNGKDYYSLITKGAAILKKADKEDFNKESLFG